MQAWVDTCGPIDFEEPATLWIDAEPGSPSASAWHSNGLTLAEAIREALACEPRRRAALRITCGRFPEPLDFQHIRALHGHPDYPSERAAPPRPAGNWHRTRIIVDIESSDEADLDEGVERPK